MRRGLYPVQPFMLVNTSRYYKILPQPPQSERIVHYYTFDANSEKAGSLTGIPDGCVDILFNAGSGGAEGYLYGMVTGNVKVKLKKGDSYFGVRFMPGYIPARFDVAIPELVDRRADVRDMPGGEALIARVAEAGCFAERAAVIDRYIGNDWRSSDLLQLLIGAVERSGGCARIADLENKTMYSARYINKVFTQNIGVSPKEFSEHVRFQSLIARLNVSETARLTDIAADAGYYDQSHFIREFKRFTAVTPREYADAVDLPTYYEKIVYVDPR
ncbi:MAG: helix-turn-helix domain-containing protein [Oscillospiraceae bacterium]|nr:helix-turn-helix domain-containing protein [Oscillospiraceae bacterium]